MKLSKLIPEASYTRVVDTYKNLANKIGDSNLSDKIERLKDVNPKKAKELDKKLNAVLSMLNNL
jgi:hypothetical protein